MPEKLINALFRPQILAMSAYHVANAEGFIKLDAMENPYSWPEELKTEWLETLRDCPLNRYPDPEARQLANSIRNHDGISDASAIMLGNGSDEIIQILLMALANTSQVLAPAPGFVMYKQLSDSLGLGYHGIPLLADSLALDLPTMLQSISEQQPAIIFIAYPNNPTGNLFAEQDILAIINAAPGLVIIDEAYAPFAKASFLTRLADFPQLLVMRTVSKLGLAGLRLGYIAGHPDIIGQLNKIRLPYNINSLTQLSAEFALNNKTLFDEQTQAICEQRTRVFAELEQLPGITPYPSAANFILFKTPAQQADAVFASLKTQGVLIKNLNPQGGLLADCLRVTIGTPHENSAFLQALKNALLAI